MGPGDLWPTGRPDDGGWGAGGRVRHPDFTDPNPFKPEGDLRFAQAIKANGRVILSADYLSADSTVKAEGASHISRAIDIFIDPAAGWGFDNFKPDLDFIVRRHMHVPPNP